MPVCDWNVGEPDDVGVGGVPGAVRVRCSELVGKQTVHAAVLANHEQLVIGVGAHSPDAMGAQHRNAPGVREVVWVVVELGELFRTRAPCTCVGAHARNACIRAVVGREVDLVAIVVDDVVGLRVGVVSLVHGCPVSALRFFSGIHAHDAVPAEAACTGVVVDGPDRVVVAEQRPQPVALSGRCEPCKWWFERDVSAAVGVAVRQHRGCLAGDLWSVSEQVREVLVAVCRERHDHAIECAGDRDNGAVIGGDLVDRFVPCHVGRRRELQLCR